MVWKQNVIYICRFLFDILHSPFCIAPGIRGAREQTLAGFKDQRGFLHTPRPNIHGWCANKTLLSSAFNSTCFFFLSRVLATFSLWTQVHGVPSKENIRHSHFQVKNVVFTKLTQDGQQSRFSVIFLKRGYRQPWTSLSDVIPDNCHFWYATTFFRPVKGTPKSA